VIRELKDFGCLVDIFDPWADAAEVHEEYGLEMLPAGTPAICDYQAVFLAVAHKELCTLPICPSSTQVVYDIKSVLPESDGSL
jgi:UDP-N-acetyl-D-galactosamine dehydrogenase